MRLKITHTTRYRFDAPIAMAFEQLRKTPRSGHGQTVLWWETAIEGGQKELAFDDYLGNRVELVTASPGVRELVMRSEGEVEVIDRAGIVGPHAGVAPLWLFRRPTPLTRPGSRVRALARKAKGRDDISLLHDLSARVRAAIAYETGASEVGWGAEQVLEAGAGVCQDHAHVFIACARHLGYPVRYVSGYLMMKERVEQEAGHAWAEVHVADLGWVGFDVSNGISPDARHVRVAVAPDHDEAAPIRGLTFGTHGEALEVAVSVAQQ